MNNNYRRHRKDSSHDVGHEAARRHIREAEEFSHEIGSYDKDVKEYFFSLPSHELNVILKEYGVNFGTEAEVYARQTFNNWKNGKRRMSGLVAKRLFGLLPPKMSERKKYELAENIWTHFGPTSCHYYTIGANTNVDDLASIVAGKLDEVVQYYSIPDNIKNRFHWLSAGDIQVEEQLLNHFRQAQKNLAVQKILHEIPLLQQQMRSYPDITHKLSSTLQIHKHIVNIEVNRRLDDAIINQKFAPVNRRVSSSSSQWSPAFLTMLKFLIPLFVIFFIYFVNSN